MWLRDGQRARVTLQGHTDIIYSMATWDDDVITGSGGDDGSGASIGLFGIASSPCVTPSLPHFPIIQSVSGT